jgi:hypothetical protein
MSCGEDRGVKKRSNVVLKVKTMIEELVCHPLNVKLRDDVELGKEVKKESLIVKEE